MKDMLDKEVVARAKKKGIIIEKCDWDKWVEEDLKRKKDKDECVGMITKLVKCPNCGVEFAAERIVAPEVSPTGERKFIYVRHECENIDNPDFWAFEFLIVNWHFDLLPDVEEIENNDD